MRLIDDGSGEVLILKNKKERKGLVGGLDSHVLDHVDLGCHEMSHSLGIQAMPEGYALMLNRDKTHFYWLRHDGIESCICWDKWAVYRGAKTDVLNQAAKNA